MRISSGNGRDAEILLTGVSAGALATAAAWTRAGLAVPQCAFHAITGHPCPTCGGTRCALALLHGHVAEAIAWNPLVFAGLCALVIANVYSYLVLAGQLPALRIRLSRHELRLAATAFGFLFATNWAYLIFRGI
jgi:hypothetical protein